MSTTKTREATIERRVCDHARRLGWHVLKFTSPGRRGVPDRIMLRRGVCVFVEFKAPGEEPSALQAHEHEIMRSRGFAVYVVDSLEAGRAMLKELQRC